MGRKKYTLGDATPKRNWRKITLITLAVALIIGGGLAVYALLSSPDEKEATYKLEFDTSVTEAEQQKITKAIAEQHISFGMDVTVSAHTSTTGEGIILDAYVPVTQPYAVRQSVTSTELQDQIDALPASATSAAEVSGDAVVFIPASQLSPEVKLLKLDGAYYLDDFAKGAVYRQVTFASTAGNPQLDLHVELNDLPGKEQVLKINQTGVTALTRLMMRKLSSVGDATYFSAKIGDFLADADITHISNEVSFQAGCQYSNTSFCSPPEFIETLKDSGVDLVEITGNHNNDRGNQYNTETIKLYHSLGWNTFGGGLNKEEASKPYIADQKDSKIAFIGYNMADGPGSGAIAGDTTAGANYYTAEKAKADIAAAKENSQFVIVNIQYAECQAYPAGYVEFPECDGPIAGQREAFRNMIDLGADLVMGSSAHQPQTYEFYKGKPIYYGLGNLYFEQTQWPGTERGIVLTHYFGSGGKLLQTKLTFTVYDRDYQTRILSEADTTPLLERLNAAR